MEMSLEDHFQLSSLVLTLLPLYQCFVVDAQGTEVANLPSSGGGGMGEHK